MSSRYVHGALTIACTRVYASQEITYTIGSTRAGARILIFMAIVAMTHKLRRLALRTGPFRHSATFRHSDKESFWKTENNRHTHSLLVNSRASEPEQELTTCCLPSRPVQVTLWHVPGVCTRVARQLLLSSLTLKPW